MLKTILNILKVLNSETDATQISLALSFSMITGLTPSFPWHNLLILLLILLIRVNLSTFFLGLAVFSGIAYLMDQFFFHHIGLNILSASVLQGLWTVLYNSPLWRIERFNNSVVMGSLVFSLLFFFPSTSWPD